MKIKNITSGVISLVLAVSTVCYGAAPAEPLPTSRRIAQQAVQPRPQLQEVKKQEEAEEKEHAEITQLRDNSYAASEAYSKEKKQNEQFLQNYTLKRQSLIQSKNSQNAQKIDQQIRALDGQNRRITTRLDSLLITSLQSRVKFLDAYSRALLKELSNSKATVAQQKKELEHADQLINAQMYPDSLPEPKTKPKPAVLPGNPATGK